MSVDFKSIKYNEKFDGHPKYSKSLSAIEYRRKLLSKVEEKLEDQQICTEELISVSHQNDENSDVKVVASIVLLLKEVLPDVRKSQSDSRTHDTNNMDKNDPVTYENISGSDNSNFNILLHEYNLTPGPSISGNHPELSSNFMRAEYPHSEAEPVPSPIAHRGSYT